MAAIIVADLTIFSLYIKENFKYEVQEKSPANQALTMQQLAEEYWRSVAKVSFKRGGGGVSQPLVKCRSHE